ncbi:MAG: FkbM family methyltransferase [Parvibaculum sp.]|nr:FkbM family methyltransferase [Parvibaculum sp.]
MKLRRKIAWALGFDLLRIRKSSSAEALVRRFIEQVKPTLVLDVGGNEGQFASDALSAPGTHKVVSFEPLSSAHGMLVEASRGNPRWEVAKRCAIGEASGVTKINISSFSGSSSLRPMNDTHLNAAPNTGYVGEETVDIFRLDDIARQYIKPDDRILLKIDTQGYEQNVLDGATGIMDQVVAMQIEVALVELYSGETLALDLIKGVLDQGFSVFAFCNGFGEKKTGRLLQADVFFIRT